MLNIPDPNVIFPNEYGTSCFVKNVVHAPNIEIGDYTYYDDDTDPTDFERNNVLFNYPEFGDRLIIGKFCALAQGTTFIMGPANHRIGSATTYPFNVFGGAWTEATPDHMSQLPRKGDTVVGDDVWLGRECVVMPGVKIGDGAVVAAYSVVTRDVAPYTVAGGNPVGSSRTASMMSSRTCSCASSGGTFRPRSWSHGCPSSATRTLNTCAPRSKKRWTDRPAGNNGAPAPVRRFFVFPVTFPHNLRLDR